MPRLTSAIKKLRQDRVRTIRNRIVRTRIHSAVDAYKKNPSKKTLAGAMSAVDRAAKRKIIHPKKAARLLARLVHRHRQEKMRASP